MQYNTMPCLRELSSTIKSIKIKTFTVLHHGFKGKDEFETQLKKCHPNINKCLQKFYLSARKRDGINFYNKESLTAIQPARFSLFYDVHLLFYCKK